MEAIKINVNQTKAKIIAATITAIDDQGYQDISLRKLAQKLGLTTGAVYKHFANKDDLFFTVAQQLSNDLYQTIAPKVQADMKAPKQALVTLGVALIQAFETAGNKMDFLFFNPSITAVYQPGASPKDFPLLALTKDVIAKIAQAYPAIDPETLFIKVWAFLQGYAMLVRHNVVAIDEDLMIQTINDMIGVN